mmetsp:Transcript_4322/g.16930  ORF Transcript_4322/g.16930 Transcript_4322/m.16930 type:complete len:472 (+) Transcript_4322:135-1550(+)
MQATDCTAQASLSQSVEQAATREGNIHQPLQGERSGANLCLHGGGICSNRMRSSTMHLCEERRHPLQLAFQVVEDRRGDRLVHAADVQAVDPSGFVGLHHHQATGADLASLAVRTLRLLSRAQRAREALREDAGGVGRGIGADAEGLRPHEQLGHRRCLSGTALRGHHRLDELTRRAHRAPATLEVRRAHVGGLHKAGDGERGNEIKLVRRCAVLERHRDRGRRGEGFHAFAQEHESGMLRRQHLRRIHGWVIRPQRIAWVSARKAHGQVSDGLLHGVLERERHPGLASAIFHLCVDLQREIGVADDGTVLVHHDVQDIVWQARQNHERQAQGRRRGNPVPSSGRAVLAKGIVVKRTRAEVDWRRRGRLLLLLLGNAQVAEKRAPHRGGGGCCCGRGGGGGRGAIAERVEVQQIIAGLSIECRQLGAPVSFVVHPVIVDQIVRRARPQQVLLLRAISDPGGLRRASLGCAW